MRLNLSLAPASSEREGVRAIAATGSRLAAGDAAGRVCVWFCRRGSRAAALLTKSREGPDLRRRGARAARNFVGRGALGARRDPSAPIVSLGPPRTATRHRRCRWSSDEEEDGDASDDGDEFDPWHPTLSQRLVVNPSTETVDVHAVARSDTVLVAGASDGSVAAWDAATFACRWRGMSARASRRSLSPRAGSLSCPSASARRRRRYIFRNGEIADRVALAPPARKPIGGAKLRDGCGTPALIWDGSVQQGCPVCSAGTVVSARARARREAAPRGRLRPEPARLHLSPPMTADATPSRATPSRIGEDATPSCRRCRRRRRAGAKHRRRARLALAPPLGNLRRWRRKWERSHHRRLPLPRLLAADLLVALLFGNASHRPRRHGQPRRNDEVGIKSEVREHDARVARDVRRLAPPDLIPDARAADRDGRPDGHDDEEEAERRQPPLLSMTVSEPVDSASNTNCVPIWSILSLSSFTSIKTPLATMNVGQRHMPS